mgnify:CR=1 FL=1
MNRNHRYDNGLNQGYVSDEKLSEEYIEEMGTEFTPAVDLDEDRFEETAEDAGSGFGFGLVALALAVLSLLTNSSIFAVIGIILGFIARARGSTSLGNWAIGISCAAIVIDLFFTPVYFL